MGEVGPVARRRLPTVTTLVPGISGEWVFEERALVWDNLVANLTVSSSPMGGMSEECHFSGFNFRIPISARIRGVELYTRLQINDGIPKWHMILGSAPGSYLGTAKSIDADETWRIYTRGGVFDSWNATLTPSIVNSPTFGIAYYTPVSSSQPYEINWQVSWLALRIHYVLSESDRGHGCFRSRLTDMLSDPTRVDS